MIMMRCKIQGNCNKSKTKKSKIYSVCSGPPKMAAVNIEWTITNFVIVHALYINGGHFMWAGVLLMSIGLFRQQVGNLSAHALHFARFKRKRLGASKYSNLIFERFCLVFSANQKIVNPLHCWEGEEGMRTFRG
jgi:hypothetical protein